MLLILDTCEHLIEAVAALASQIFIAAPQVHILATSREALRVRGRACLQIGSARLSARRSGAHRGRCSDVPGHPVISRARGGERTAVGARRRTHGPSGIPYHCFALGRFGIPLDRRSRERRTAHRLVYLSRRNQLSRALPCDRTWLQRGAGHPSWRRQGRDRNRAEMSGEAPSRKLPAAHHAVQHLARPGACSDRAKRRRRRAHRRDDTTG